MDLRSFLICASVILVTVILYIYVFDATELISSRLNGVKYRVRKGSRDMQHLKADILANLEYKLDTLVNTLRKKEFAFMDKKAVNRLVDRWEGIKIRETGSMESDAAYVLGKGFDFRICLQEGPFTGKPEHNNLITYVAIHELAHVMSVSYGHGDEFQKNFGDLLKVANITQYRNPYTDSDEKIYTRINFSQNPDNFCGVDITSSPY